MAGKRHTGGGKHNLSSRERARLDGVLGHASECSTGKCRYATKQLAKKVAGRLRHRGRMGAYRCSICGWWHIGHLHPDIVSGEVSRGEAYGPRPPAA